jgi:hypothetical protein
MSATQMLPGHASHCRGYTLATSFFQLKSINYGKHRTSNISKLEVTLADTVTMGSLLLLDEDKDLS